MDSNLECYVLGCHTKPDQGLRFYQLPCHNPQICSIWEQRICQSANIGFDILKDRVCELHFDYRCKTGNECALEEGSLPTLNLPSFGTLFSTGNAHFQMDANKIEEPSYAISIDTLAYHCRFCLRRGLLYEVEASTYRSKSFLSLIDLPPNVLPDNIQPNACLSCLKSIVIAHQLSVTVDHSNIILQQLLQHPKQSTVVSYTNFLNIKSELAFCNLILANSLFVKLEIEFEDTVVCANGDYEQKCVVTREPTSPAAHVNTPNMVENSICVTENQYNVSKIYDSFTSDKKCPKEFHKSFAIGAFGENPTDLSAEGILIAKENSDLGVPMKNNDANAEIIVSINSDDFCAEDGQFNNDQSPESPSKAVNVPTYKCDLCKFTANYKPNLAIHKNRLLSGQTTFTAIDKNTHWNANDCVYICPICERKTPSPYSFNAHMVEHVQSDENATNETKELETLETDAARYIDGRYQCTEYPKTLKNKSRFSQQKLIHTNKRAYKCTECPKIFRRKFDFGTHKRIHTNIKPYKCTECPKAFSHPSNLNVHKRLHTNERPYKCTECEKTFSYKTSIEAHKKTHWNERPYKCAECPKTYSQAGSLSVHMRVHTKERPYKCTECPKTFSRQNSLNRHKRIHTIERPYKCTECPKTFSHPSNLNVHKRTHTEERPYKCTECPKTFSQIGHLTVHKKVHTNERPYKCTECPQTLSQPGHLIAHMRVHTNEKPYKCTECPKTFSQAGSLSVHTRVHTKERPYKCTECPKTFSHPSNLNVHKRIHTNERPYNCTECPKTFSQMSHLTVHKKVHTNERPYKCTECPKVFSQPGHLSAHIRVHTKERPYKCTECPKNFSQSSHLTVHKKVHTNDRPYKCTESPKT